MSLGRHPAFLKIRPRLSDPSPIRIEPRVTRKLPHAANGCIPIDTSASGALCEYRSAQIQRAFRGQGPHLLEKTRPSNPLFSSYCALIRKSAYPAENRSYQSACFQTHAHSSPAKPLVSVFCTNGTGVWGGGHRSYPGDRLQADPLLRQLPGLTSLYSVDRIQP